MMAFGVVVVVVVVGRSNVQGFKRVLRGNEHSMMICRYRICNNNNNNYYYHNHHHVGSWLTFACYVMQTWLCI